MRLSFTTMSLVLMFLVSCTFLSNEHETTLKVTMVHVKNDAIKLGKLKQNKPKVATFHIKNTGSTPLFIQNVKTSCGCTIPSWTKKPVKPDKSAEITVTYDAKYPGHFQKTITVFANVDNNFIRLSISGEVEYDETLLSKE